MINSPKIDECVQTKGASSATLDFSFHEIAAIPDLLNFHIKDSLPASSVRLSNNHLTNLNGLTDTFSMILVPSDQVLWIDLSFNKLKSLDEIIQSYPNLRVLYLHGNKIDNLSELDKLSNLKELRNLTLHGNPVVEEPNYRFYILSRLPKLKHLDFSAITKQDKISIRILLKRLNNRKSNFIKS